ncbi:MAG: phytoene desaturase family protein [Candidatus Thorarchaeota archaeon]
MTISDDQFDVVIVGAGLGGLTAGAKLAKEGKKTLVIEQHSKMGGCATWFKREGITFEIGLHEMDGLDNPDNPKQLIFNDLGVYDHVQFLRVPEFYRITNGRFDVVIPHGVDEARAALSIAFPKDIDAIDTFFVDLERIPRFLRSQNLLELAPLAHQTIGGYLDSLTDNEDLKFALIGNLGYYGDDPYNLSLIFFTSAQRSFFTGGGHFVRGGSQLLSNYLAEVIEKNGGTVLRRHLAKEILAEGDRVTGVVYQKRKPKKKNEKTGKVASEDRDERVQLQTAYADVVISNASLPQLVNTLIPSLKDTEFGNTVNSMELPCSLFSFYLGFSDPPSTVGCQHYSTFVFSPELKKLKDFIRFEKSEDYEKKGFVFVDYQSFDTGLNEEGKYAGVICGIDYLDHWQKTIGQGEAAYDQKKRQTEEILLDRLDQVYPGIKDLVTVREFATPRTIVKYTMNPQGSVYGFAQTPAQSGPKIRGLRSSPFMNLYFASVWVGSGGFSGAISAGYGCASKILKNHPVINS